MQTTAKRKPTGTFLRRATGLLCLLMALTPAPAKALSCMMPAADPAMLPELVEVEVTRRYGGPRPLEQVLKHVSPTPPPKFDAKVVDPLRSLYTIGTELSFKGSNRWPSGFTDYNKGERVLLRISVPRQKASHTSFEAVGPSGMCGDGRQEVLQLYRSWQTTAAQLGNALATADFDAALDTHDQAAKWQDTQLMQSALTRALGLQPGHPRIQLRQTIQKIRAVSGPSTLNALATAQRANVPQMLQSPHQDIRAIASLLALDSNQANLLDGARPVFEGDLYANLLPAHSPQWRGRFTQSGQPAPVYRIEAHDLSGRDLSGMRVHSIEFDSITLTGANLRGTVLVASDINNSKLRGTNLIDLQASDSAVESAEVDCTTTVNSRATYNLLGLAVHNCPLP